MGFSSSVLSNPVSVRPTGSNPPGTGGGPAPPPVIAVVALPTPHLVSSLSWLSVLAIPGALNGFNGPGLSS